VIAPEPNPRNKKLVSQYEDRLMMAGIAADDNKGIRVLRSIKPDKPHSLSSITEDLSKIYSLKEVKIMWLMGADTFYRFGDWNNHSELEDFEFIVAERSDKDTRKIREYAKSVSIVVHPLKIDSQASSSEIRQGNIRYLNSKVKAYIKENSLYTDS